MPGELRILTYGGAHRDGLAAAMFGPYAARYGVAISVLEGDNVGPLERARNEIAGGDPSFDVMSSNQTYYQQGRDEGLWEPIDYGCFVDADLAAIPPHMRLSHGVGALVHSNNLVHSTVAFPDGGPQPRSWSDFWDVERFPGRRALPVCDAGINPLPEVALMADGVSPEGLYPMDVERAARRLEELAPHVAYWKNGAESVRLLTDGTATLGLLGNGRAQAAIDSGAPLKMVWNNARVTFDVWYVLRGARNVEEAMRFVAFSQKPEPQAALARLTGFAPTNADAYRYLDETAARRLPTYPANAEQTFRNDETWWQQNRQSWVAICRTALGQ
jgi:putative spermidine/putrescine transport system substrate-binding protein